MVTSRIVSLVISAIGVLLLVTGGAPTAGAAPAPGAEPSVVITVEWMNTSGDARSRVPWMFDLTVELTSSTGVDVGGQCRQVVWADQQPSFLGIRFDCFDIPDGSYGVELIGVPEDESARSQCQSVEVPAAPDVTGLGCLTSFFSAGVIVDYPPASVPDGASPPTSDPTPGTDGLPVTGGPVVELLMLGLATLGAGLLLSTVGRRRMHG